MDRTTVRLDATGCALHTPDTRLTEACEPGSIAPFSLVPETPGEWSAKQSGGGIEVNGPPKAKAMLWIAGIRKGMPGRFREVSEQRAQKNNWFWSIPWNL